MLVIADVASDLEDPEVQHILNTFVNADGVKHQGWAPQMLYAPVLLDMKANSWKKNDWHTSRAHVVNISSL